jgi:hypothetical protein
MNSAHQCLRQVYHNEHKWKFTLGKEVTGSCEFWWLVTVSEWHSHLNQLPVTSESEVLGQFPVPFLVSREVTANFYIPVSIQIVSCVNPNSRCWS